MLSCSVAGWSSGRSGWKMKSSPAQFCFRYRDTVSLLQEGFHPKYTAEKVGYALRAHALQEMISTGARRYDFLGGADAYKARFGSTQGKYLNLYFAGPSWKGRLVLIARQRIRAAKSLAENTSTRTSTGVASAPLATIAGQQLRSLLECQPHIRLFHANRQHHLRKESATLARRWDCGTMASTFPALALNFSVTLISPARA